MTIDGKVSSKCTGAVVGFIYIYIADYYNAKLPFRGKIQDKSNIAVPNGHYTYTHYPPNVHNRKVGGKGRKVIQLQHVENVSYVSYSTM